MIYEWFTLYRYTYNKGVRRVFTVLLHKFTATHSTKKSFRSFLTACLPNSEKLNSLMHPLFTSCHCVIIHLHAGRIIIHLQAGRINNILVSKSNNSKRGADCTVAILARSRRVARPPFHIIKKNLILFCLYFLHRLKKVFLFVYC